MVNTRTLKRLMGGGIATIATLALALPTMAVAAPGSINSDVDPDDWLENVQPAEDPQPADGTTDNGDIPSDRVIGFIAQDYNRPMFTDELEYSAESTLSSFIPDALMVNLRAEPAVRHVNFAVFNTSHLAADLRINTTHPEGRGAVTWADVQALFANPLESFAIVEMTAPQIVGMLNEQYTVQPSGKRLRLGISDDLNYTYRYEPDGGDKVTLPDVRLGGEKLDLETTYLVAVAQDLISELGRWNFPSLREARVVNANHGLTWADAVRNVLAAAYPDPIKHAPHQRSVGLFHTDSHGRDLFNPEGVLQQGDVVGGQFTSLLYTAQDQEPRGHDVTIFVGGERLAATLVDYKQGPRDNLGDSKFQFVIPRLAPGEHRVEIKLSGTTVLTRTVQIEPSETYHDYVDVAPTNHFAREIEWVTVAGIATGWKISPTEWRYERYQPVLRDQMAAFIFRLGLIADPSIASYSPPRTSPFEDVSTRHPFYKEICWLHYTKISTGWPVGDGKFEFRPYSPVLRDQMAAFLYRFAVMVVPMLADWPTPDESFFADMHSESTFNREVQFLYNFEIASGWNVDGQLYFRPYRPVLRDQMAAFLERSYRMFVSCPADLR